MEIDASPAETAADSKSARTSTRTKSRGRRVELITRGETRRRWSVEQKQAIAAMSFAPGVPSTDVAREYGISSGLLSTWRKALLAAQPAPVPSLGLPVLKLLKAPSTLRKPVVRRCALGHQPDRLV